MKPLTNQMAQYLTFAINHGGVMRVSNGSLKRAMLERDLIKLTSGYGWGHGGIQEITDKGRAALAQHNRNAILSPFEFRTLGFVETMPDSAWGGRGKVAEARAILSLHRKGFVIRFQPNSVRITDSGRALLKEYRAGLLK